MVGRAAPDETIVTGWGGNSIAMGKGPLNGLGHGGYWRGFNTMFYSDLINNNSVVLLSNRGESLD